MQQLQQDPGAYGQGAPQGYVIGMMPVAGPQPMMVTMIPPHEGDGNNGGNESRFHGPPRRFGGGRGGNSWRGGGKGMYGRRGGGHGKQMRPQATCQGYSGEQLYKPSFSEDPWACFYETK